MDWFKKFKNPGLPAPVIPARQPVEWVESENGNKALCYYSLGNYVSTQKGALSMLEAMAWVTFLVKEDGIEILEEKTGFNRNRYYVFEEYVKIFR